MLAGSPRLSSPWRLGGLTRLIRTYETLECRLLPRQSVAFEVAAKLYSASVDSSVLPPVVLIVEVNVVPGGCIEPTTG